MVKLFGLIWETGSYVQTARSVGFIHDLYLLIATVLQIIVKLDEK